MDPIPTLKWMDGYLRLIDQRELPGRETYIDCMDVETLAGAIRTLAVRGAPAIGIAAAFGCVLAAIEAFGEQDPINGFHMRLELLESTRPTAVNLFHCIAIQRGVYDSVKDHKEAVQALLSSAMEMMDADLEASRAMGRYGAELLAKGSTVLTHCNAGGLATAGLGTALAVIYEAWDRMLLKKVYADETRPLLQGARLTSWELSRAGIPVDVLPDSAAASLLRSGRVDAVVVGSDRIAANGDIANKIGTYSLALAARANDVPFYVAAPVSTFDAATGTGEAIVIEQRARNELASLGGKILMPDGAGAWNPAFDVTPASLISAIICERGVIREPDAASIEDILA